MKNTFKLFLAAFLAAFLCVGAFAISLDGAESSSEGYIASEASLASAVIPGINVVTGTEAVATFDEENAADYLATFSSDNYDSVSITDLPDTLDAKGALGKALTFYHPAFTTESGEIWHTVIQSFNGYDGQRKYLIKADMAYYVGDGSAEQAADVTNRWSVFESMTAANVHTGVATSVNSWSTWNVSAVPRSGYKLKFRHRAGTSASESSADSGACTYDLYTYLDNFAIYPYYKVTYMNADGTETVAIDYVLITTISSFLSTSLPTFQR